MPPHTQSRIAIVATAIVIGLAYLSGGARGIGAGDRDVVFSPAVDPRVQAFAPAAHVPLGARTTATSLTARGSLAVALGRRSAVRDFAAVSAAIAAAAFAAVLRAAGFPALVIIAAMIGMAAGDTFWWRGTTYTADALFPALLMGTVWAALRWQTTRRRTLIWVAAVFAVAAIADFVVPMTGGALRASTTPGFVASLVREFTPLGLFLVSIGLLALLRSRSTRLQAATLTAVLLMWHGLWRSVFEPVNVTIVVAGWGAIAVALAWLWSVVSDRSRTVLIAVIGVVLIATPVATRLRGHTLGGDRSSEQRVRTANDFPVRQAPEGVMVIAESQRADAALLLSARVARRPIEIVPQSVDAVAAALETGRPVLAFASAGANLERYGFLFEPTVIGEVAAAVVVGRVQCVALDDETWTDVSLLASNGSLIVHGGTGAAPAGVVIRMAAAEPVRVAAVEPRRVRFEIGDVPRDAEGVAELIKASGHTAPAAISSLRLPASGELSSTVTFGSPPAYAVATSEDPIETTICPGVQRSGVVLGAGATAVAAVQMNDNAPFGTGWHPMEADPDFFRWTSAPESSLRISVARPGRVRVTITATPASRPAQKPTIALRVNDCRLDARSMHAGQGDYEWTVDDRCWRAGANQLWISTSPLISPASLFATHDTRLLGARIGAIRFARVN